MRRGLVPVLSALLLLAWAAPARADTQTASRGAVTATLTYSLDSDPFSYSDLHLTIQRAGQVLFDAAPTAPGCGDGCWPGGGRHRDSVHVRELDGDGEPEVLLDLYTRGAHCCALLNVYRFTGGGYGVLTHDFGDPGYRVGDINGDGHPEIVSADDRFAYRFTAFAFSLMPVQIWSYRAGHLHAVTRRFRGRIRADAARNWHWYRKFLRHRGEGYEPRGAAAAWAADEYRLGKRRRTLRTLRRLAVRGELPGFPPRDQLRFVARLDRFLRRLGYA